MPASYKTNPLNLTTLAGLGGLAVNRRSQFLKSLIDIPEFPGNEFTRTADAFIRSGLHKLPAEDFATEYAQHGHRLTRAAVKHFGKETTVGDVVMDAKTKLFDRLAKILPKPLHIGMIREHIANKDNDYLKAESAAHYKAFSESPMAAYRKLVDELGAGDIYTNNRRLAKAPTHWVGIGRDAKEVLTPDLPNAFADILSMNRADRKAYIESMPWHVNPRNKVDFNPFFDDLARQLKLDPMKPAKRMEALKLLNKYTFADVHSPTLVGHMHELLKGKEFAQVADPLYYNTNNLLRFGNLLIAGHARQATQDYNNFYKATKLFNRLGGKGLLGLSAGTVALGLAPWIKEKIDGVQPPTIKSASQTGAEGSSWSPLATILPAIGGGVLGGSAVEQASLHGFNKLNPFGELRGMVFGGASTGKGSFASQSKALVKDLKKLGLGKVNWHPAMQVTNQLVPGKGLVEHFSPISRVDQILNSRGLDFIINAGAHPEDTLIRGIADQARIRKYRLLTDYGPGNFQQPDSWLGSKNWMKVHRPEQYDRLFVPGGKHFNAKEMKALAKGTPITNIGSIPVSEVFRGASFAAKDSKNPFTVISLGGGAASVTPLDDTAKEVVKKLKDGRKLFSNVHDPKLPNFLDDISKAHLAAYGPEARIKMLMAEAASATSGDTGKFWKNIMSQKKRFSNIDFIEGMIPQEQLAKEYFGKARNIVMLPGSTVSELAAMKGVDVPNIAALIPKYQHWKPDHWAANSHVLRKNIPTTFDINLGAPSDKRLEALTKFFEKPLEVLPKRTPMLSDVAPAYKAIVADARLARAANLLKFTGKSLGAGALFGLGLSNLAGIGRHRAIEKQASIPKHAVKPFWAALGVAGLGAGATMYGLNRRANMPESPSWDPTQNPHQGPGIYGSYPHRANYVGALLPAMALSAVGGLGAAIGGGSPISGAVRGLGTGAGFTAGGYIGNRLSDALGVQDPTSRLITALVGAGLGSYVGNKATTALMGDPSGDKKKKNQNYDK